MGETNPSSPPPSSHLPLPPLFSQQNPTPLRPSITILVAVLTAMFSVTFLLLLYAKHCKRNDGNFTSSAPSAARRNSGIERSVIESLPIFRFASLRGHKQGLECCVCLNRFEPNEILKLLPKCKHAFHVECVDTWLDAHSTCPLCRYRVDPEDVLLVDKDGTFTFHEEAANDLGKREPDEFTRRISGRHSSAGERTSRFLQILVERPGTERLTQNDSFRKSVDSGISRNRFESVTSGCFDRGSSVRKDGLLLSEAAERQNFLRRFEHRIILSTEGGPSPSPSGLRPTDLLFLQSQKIISNTGRYSLSSSKKKHDVEDGRNAINTRCVSEITGLSRVGN